MIEKFYYYCSYNDSLNGYESTKVQFNNRTGKYSQSELTSEDVEYYLDKLYSYNGNIKLYKDKSTDEVILIINNIHELFPEDTNIRDKYISIMICGDSEQQMSYLTLSLICNTKKIIYLIYDSVILKPNKNSNNSYTINSEKLKELEKMATKNTELNLLKLPFIRHIMALFERTTDIKTASYYLSKVTNYNAYKNNTIFKVLEKIKKDDFSFPLRHIFRRNTFTVFLNDFILYR